MTTIIPDNEAIKKAVRWISEHLKENPAADKKTLINEASFRFNLSPKESFFLQNFYSKNDQDTIH
ncbi:MAG: hypothetical protein JXR46_12755 [Calditrichaceae bacterium]|nr:hypothetical protein [Calditrichaceae bacterium]MBN2709905.1 hypothetical protein [Calditrichaceae bacterium]RQV92705.1 MAG: hypothetical protein EH224_14860 [Calditrichota bacterium]